MTDKPSVTKPVRQKIALDLIRTDGGTQPRGNMDAQAVSDYADAMKAKVKFPPVEVYFDGETYWLADGFHRVAAAKECKHKVILASVYQGDQRAAVLRSCGANDTNGLRRTREDARSAITKLLKDEEWGQWTDREISRRCKVHHQTVASVRQSLILSGEIRQIEERKTERAGTKYTVDTSKTVVETASRKTEVVVDPAKSWDENYGAMVAENQDKSVFIAPGEKSQHWMAFGATAAALAEKIGRTPVGKIKFGEQFIDVIIFKVGSPLDANRLDRLESLIGETAFYLETDAVFLNAILHSTRIIHDPNILAREKAESEADSRRWEQFREQEAREAAAIEETPEPDHVQIESSDNGAFPKPGLPAQPTPAWPTTPQEATDEQRAAALFASNKQPGTVEIDSVEEGLELVDQHLSAILALYHQIHALDDERAHHIGGFLLRLAQNKIVPTQATVRKLIERPADIVYVRAEIEESENEIQLRGASMKASGLRVDDDWIDRELLDLFAAVAARREQLKAAA